MSTKQRQHVHISLFLAASLLAHALLLIESRRIDLPLATRAYETAGSVLQVSLQHAAEPRSDAIDLSTPAQIVTAKKTSRQNSVRAGKESRMPTTLDASHARESHSHDAPVSPGAETRARVLSRVREDLDRHFVYPVLARRQGWQGQVLLGFSVAANGMIENVHVQRGSGYRVLDESAQTALSRIRQLHQIDSWLHGQSMQLQLSVVYRLQGG